MSKNVLEITKEEYANLLESLATMDGSSEEYTKGIHNVETLAKTISILETGENKPVKDEKIFGRFDPDKVLFISVYAGIAILSMVYESNGHILPMKFINMIKN